MIQQRNPSFSLQNQPHLSQIHLNFIHRALQQMIVMLQKIIGAQQTQNFCQGQSCFSYRPGLLNSLSLNHGNGPLQGYSWTPPSSTQRTSPSQKDSHPRLHELQSPTASSAAQKRSQYAQSWAGKHYKYGQKYRCADFVSHVLKQSHTAPKGFASTAWAPDFARMGEKASKQQLKPGDVVLFDNTYEQGKYTHVGIYIGQGKFVHRPTMAKAVQVDRLDQGYWSQKFSEGRRIN